MALVEVKPFVETLRFVQSFVPDASPRPALRRTLLRGRIMVGQSDDAGVLARSSVQFPAEGGVVDGKRLLQYLEFFDEGESVEFDVREEKFLDVRGKKSSARFAFPPLNDYPVPVVPKADLVGGEGDSFALLDSTAFCTSDQEMAGVLNGVLLDGRGSWAADGARAAHVAAKTKLTTSIVVPRKAVALACSLGSPSRWGTASGRFWAFFPDKVAWAQLLDAEYPDLGSLFADVRKDAPAAPSVRYEREELAREIERVMSSGGSEVRLKIEKGRVLASCRGEFADVTTAAACDARGAAEFGAEAAKLVDAVRRFSSFAYCPGGRIYFSGGGLGEHVLMEMVR